MIVLWHTYFVALGLAVLYCLLHILVLWVAYKMLRSVFLNAFIAHPLLPIAFSQISILWIFGTWCVYLYDVFSLTPMLTKDVLNHFPTMFPAGNSTAWEKGIEVLWGSIALAYVACLVFNFRTFNIELRHTKRLHSLAKAQAPFHVSIPSWFQPSLEQALSFWKHKKRPIVLFFSGKVGPLTISVIKPIIIYPTAALNHLTPDETSAIIAHEVSHIFSADFYTNVILKFIVAVLPLNPWLKIWLKDVQFFQEIHCDKRVLQFYPRQTYVNALIKVAEYGQVSLAQNAQSELLERMKYMYGEFPAPALRISRFRLRLHTKPFSILLATLVIVGSLSISNAKKEISSPPPTASLAVHLPIATPHRYVAPISPHSVASASAPKPKVVVSAPVAVSHPSSSVVSLSKKEIKKVDAKVENMAELEKLSLWQTNDPKTTLAEDATLTPVAHNVTEEEEIKNLQHFIVQSTLWMLNNKFFFPDGLEIQSLTPEELSLLMSERNASLDWAAKKIKHDVANNHDLASLRTTASQLKEKVIYFLYLETLDQGSAK